MILLRTDKFTFHRPDPVGLYRWTRFNRAGRAVEKSKEGFETRDAAVNDAREKGFLPDVHASHYC
jgi:hypothetical protein